MITAEITNEMMPVVKNNPHDRRTSNNNEKMTKQN